MNCSVHRYKYSQSTRRSRLKRMKKDGILKLNYVTKSHFHYIILDIESYRRRAK